MHQDDAAGGQSLGREPEVSLYRRRIVQPVYEYQIERPVLCANRRPDDRNPRTRVAPDR